MNYMRYVIAYGMVALVFLTFLLPVISSIKSKRAEHLERKQFSKKIHDAIEKITADGKVEGPKGRYIPRRKHGAMTDPDLSKWRFDSQVECSNHTLQLG